jgi:hypothetical protein
MNQQAPGFVPQVQQAPQQQLQVQSGYPGLDPAVRSILEGPFPADVIKNDVKRSTDGFQPTYVPAPEIIKRLNAAFNSKWSFEIMQDQFVPPTAPTQIVVRGRLTVGIRVTSQDLSMQVDSVIVKEQYGSCFIKSKNGMFIDIGSDMKAAATDALKKCATLFGIALELYDKDEQPMQGLHRVGGEQPSHGTFPAQQMNPNAPAEPFQIQSVVNYMSRLGKHDGIWQQEMGLAHPSQLTQGMVQQILSGTHPYVAPLIVAAGHQPGLTASAA